MSVSTSRIMDLLTEAASRMKREGTRGVEWVFDHMSSDEKLAFDLFLVRMKSPLAYQAGTVEYRFKEETRRLAFPGGENANEAQDDSQDDTASADSRAEAD